MGRRNAAVRSNCRIPWRIVRAVAAAALAFAICDAIGCGAIGCGAIGEARAEGTLPGGLVYLRDVDPSITQDMRYAGSNNFVGRPLDGYGAGECILRRDVAVALARVQTDLSGSGLALKVYDCYRPVRAVRTMAQWANDGRAGGATKRFYPRLQKNVLFGLGYIASRSAHSTGNTIDLTLVEAPPAPTAAFDPAASYGPCTGTAAQRSPDTSIDMGTGYDCFDAVSSTASAGITAEQRRRRNQLVAAMAKRGFANYHREWWHFSYGNRGPSYDVPIRPRPAKAP
jgi:zinc D-Ala-D-Ala dipeptidase